MKRNIIIIIILIVLISAFTLGESSINPLTRGLADELYCFIDGTNCVLGGGGGANGTLWSPLGSWLIPNTTLTGGVNDVSVDRLNASQLCLNTSHCITRWDQVNISGGGGGVENTSAQMLNATAVYGGNTTEQIWGVVDNGTFPLNSTFEDYLPLTGGELSGPLIINVTDSFAFQVNQGDGTNRVRIDTSADWLYTGNIRPRSDSAYDIGQDSIRYDHVYTNNISANIYLIPDGTAGIPSISLVADPTTGIYNGGTAEITLVQGGINRLSATTRGVNIEDAGSENSPSLYFASDIDTGFYHAGADQLALSVGGQDVWSYVGSILTMIFNPDADDMIFKFFDTNQKPLVIIDGTNDEIRLNGTIIIQDKIQDESGLSYMIVNTTGVFICGNC